MNPKLRHDPLEQALRRVPPRRNAPAGFAERVIDALPARPSAAPHHSPFERPHGPRLAWAGLLALLTFAAWLTFAPKPERPAPLIAVQDAQTISPAVFNLPPINLHQVQALTVKVDEPLERELKLVLSDTRNAIRFVASNFLPDN